MPNPEDDWTRPMPRTPRPRRDPEDRHEGDRRQDDRRQDDWSEDDWRQDETERIPAPRSSDRGDRGAPPPRPPRRRRPAYGFRRFLALVAFLLIAYVVAMVVVVAMVWGSIDQVDAAPDVPDRPGGSAGETYLLVGTDSREGLTAEQRGDFGTGSTEGSRTDTVMMLHVPTMGDPTLVSLPRDSYLPIRDQGTNKLNASYSLGGPELLVDTVEQATGLRIGGYLEIGFGGFVGVVDEVGGVEMCLEAPIQDEKAHLDLPAGCQELTGTEALGYVRMRYSDPRGDIGRVERQREFLAALVQKMASPAIVLNPWSLHQVGTATGGALAIGEDTSMLEGARIALAMRAVANGNGNSLTVPVADMNYQTDVGSAVLWDEVGAEELFAALRRGDAVTIAP
ncbi:MULTISPECIES: LCP family protein [unclassified Ornithinimicrobium]|uniref:LCP family protein n=1 Tax=unclassified Ornithinimicrobium TaxID=2615080 RepID=UPI0038528CAA